MKCAYVASVCHVGSVNVSVMDKLCRTTAGVSKRRLRRRSRLSLTPP